MGVYIKGMEMPPNCCQCAVNMEVCKRGYEYLLKHPELYDKRADDCPLVPVHTPHGRLIDESALLKGCGYIIADGMACIPVKHIANAPTIIEAEEGE